VKSLEQSLREQAHGDFSSVQPAGELLPPFDEKEMTTCTQALCGLVNRRQMRDETVVHLPSAVMPLLL